MYIGISTLNVVKAGEVLVLKVDRSFGLVGAYDIGGALIGYVSETQPEGCMDVWEIYAAIGDNRVLTTAAVALGNTVILYTDSRVFRKAPTVTRIEREGYGLLSVK